MPSGILGTLYCSTLLALMFSIKFDPRRDSWNVFMAHMTYGMFMCRYEAEAFAANLTAQKYLFPEAFENDKLLPIAEMSDSLPNIIATKEALQFDCLPSIFCAGADR
jgi:hypothetical protein